MKVRCSSCDKQWETEYLEQELILEIGLSNDDIIRWQSLPPLERLSDENRQEFVKHGWQFGNSVVNIVRCPRCPPWVKENLERVSTKNSLEKLFGNDIAGLVATFEEYEL